ncbi:WXG100 family type VII secretion target [Peterkaempfera sp. SMS 1(5)a]|uniref:WXG100 family type VII secretion target n=1 Tax=Peterkaempfera podocarpi TaxID=3232308 RepID=UPI00366FC0B5
MPHKSNFEGESHGKLRAMVESSDPSFVMDVGTRLTNAHQVMQDIGNDLMDRMNALDWTGAAADSFKDWGRQVSKATLELSDYSGTAGTYMTSAGETLSTAKKAMPDVPESDMKTVAKHRSQPSARVGGGLLGGLLGGPLGAVAGSAVGDKAMKAVDPNWVTDSEAHAAQTRIDSAHQQAIAQMEKVGQSYEESSSRMKAATLPVFPPTPETLMPPRPTGRDESVAIPVGRSGGTGSSSTGGSTGGTVKGAKGVTHQDVLVQEGQPKGTVKSPVKSPTVGGTGKPPANTGIDGVTLAPAPTSPTNNSPALPVSNGPGGGGSSYAPPAGGFQGGKLPAGGGSGLGGLGGGKPRPGYKGGVVGEGETGLVGGSSRRPGYGGTTVGAEEGAHAGGTGRTPGGSRAGSRGAGSGAFGELEEGHGGAAGGAHGGAGGGARGGARGGSGRRLTTEEGGMVGGRRGRGASGEFTPGGSGLRARGGGAANELEGQGGMPGGSAGNRKSKEKRGQRPDYLVEDEESWMSGAADSNPTVIE